MKKIGYVIAVCIVGGALLWWQWPATRSRMSAPALIATVTVANTSLNDGNTQQPPPGQKQQTAPPAPEELKAKAEVKAKAEAEKKRYYAAVREEMKTWGDKGRDTGVYGFLTKIAKTTPEDMATIERWSGIKFNDPALSTSTYRSSGKPLMTTEDWIKALLDAGTFPGTLEDWNSDACRAVRDPQRSPEIALTGVWAAIVNTIAATPFENNSLRQACEWYVNS